jgi:hypothetical protein
VVRIFFCGANSGKLMCHQALILRLQEAKVPGKSRDFKSRCEGVLDDIASIRGGIGRAGGVHNGSFDGGSSEWRLSFPELK